MVFRWDDIELDKVTEMVSRKQISAGPERVTQTYLKKGALVARHSHPGTQWIYVLQGMLRVTAGPDVTVVREGEVLHLGAGIAHQAEALDDSFVLDIRR